MRLRTVRLPYKEGDVYTLYAWGDWHRFSANCDKTALLETRDAIEADPKALYLHMGDGHECITPDDKRWHAGGIDERLVTFHDIDRLIDVAVEDAFNFERPVIAKCIGVHDGNHERTANKYNSTNIVQRKLRLLSTAAGGEYDDLYYPGHALTRLVFADKQRHTCTLVIQSAHGTQAGRMDGAKINRMKQMLAFFRADILLRGHSHSLFASPVDWLEGNAVHTHIVAHRGYVAHTGSYFRTYQQEATSYGETGDYPPTSIGCPRFLLYPSRDGARIEAVT